MLTFFAPQEALPYKSKPKVPAKVKRKGYLAGRAVVMDPAEKKAAALYASLSAIRNEKAVKRREQQTRRRGVSVNLTSAYCCNIEAAAVAVTRGGPKVAGERQTAHTCAELVLDNVCAADAEGCSTDCWYIASCFFSHFHLPLSHLLCIRSGSRRWRRRRRGGRGTTRRSARSDTWRAGRRRSGPPRKRGMQSDWKLRRRLMWLANGAAGHRWQTKNEVARCSSQ